jgi:acetyltransferase
LKQQFDPGESRMTIRNLQHLFNPASLAVIGASQKLHSVGATVLQNVVDGGFRGAIMPVNPKYDQLLGLKTYGRVADLPITPDLAIICTPPTTVPTLIKELGKRGTKAAIVLTVGLGNIKNSQGVTLKKAMLDAAKPHLLRILGPNSVGLLVPGIGLNASSAHTDALPGKIAFVSQSGALVSGMLDWAKSREIGFSKFISLGERADIDFGDVLNYLANDDHTRAILMYMEDININAARKFMSAARATARTKQVIVLKAGRTAESAKAASSHTGALAGSDEVYDAAIRRAGMLRVFSTEGLFNAVETLARARPECGDRLAIMTNGGGLGVIATDALILRNGRLAKLSAETIAQLDKVLPPTWSHNNPVDIIGDTPSDRYVQTMEILLRDPGIDAILFIHAPTANVPCAEIARALVPVVQSAKCNILSCWLGGATVLPAQDIFAEAGIPSYATPEKAIGGFMQIVQYRRNQDLLLQVPPSLPRGFVPDRGKVQKIVHDAIEEGRTALSEQEAKQVLAAYGIQVVETRVAKTVKTALKYAGEIGYPVALKILSAQISHKSDVGGVTLNLETAEALRAAAAAMRKRVKRLRPDACVDGFSVQAMARCANAHELIAGVSTDPVFGPVILFGQGGVAVEVTNDHAIGLPPLNMVLAKDMISRTRVAKLLAGYRNRPPADIDAICRTLIQVAHLAADVPELTELDINPLLADADGVMVLDARMRIAPAMLGGKGAKRLAIRPYPDELEERISWQQGQTLLLRPIRPEDSGQHLAFFHALDAADLRFRTFSSIRELDPSGLARLTQIDYDREMAFVAVRDASDGKAETLGVVRAVVDPDNISAEFAIIIRSDMKGKGLGRILFKKLIDYFRQRGTQVMVGEALAHNHGVQNLVRHFGFAVSSLPGDGTVELRLDLQAALGTQEKALPKAGDDAVERH